MRMSLALQSAPSIHGVRPGHHEVPLQVHQALTDGAHRLVRNPFRPEVPVRLEPCTGRTPVVTGSRLRENQKQGLHVALGQIERQTVPICSSTLGHGMAEKST